MSRQLAAVFVEWREQILNTVKVKEVEIFLLDTEQSFSVFKYDRNSKQKKQSVMCTRQEAKHCIFNYVKVHETFVISQEHFLNKGLGMLNSYSLATIRRIVYSQKGETKLKLVAF